MKFILELESNFFFFFELFMFHIENYSSQFLTCCFLLLGSLQNMKWVIITLTPQQWNINLHTSLMSAKITRSPNYFNFKLNHRWVMCAGCKFQWKFLMMWLWRVMFWSESPNIRRNNFYLWPASFSISKISGD